MGAGGVGRRAKPVARSRLLPTAARVGVVMGLEVSRLARSSTDWHRLLEICALADTLILDEDGVYDPSHFNDRLLLGLKGTMSEAELHILRARLIGGQRGCNLGAWKSGCPSWRSCLMANGQDLQLRKALHHRLFEADG